MPSLVDPKTLLNGTWIVKGFSVHKENMYEIKMFNVNVLKLTMYKSKF